MARISDLDAALKVAVEALEITKTRLASMEQILKDNFFDDDDIETNMAAIGDLVVVLSPKISNALEQIRKIGI